MDRRRRRLLDDDAATCAVLCDSWGTGRGCVTECEAREGERSLLQQDEKEFDDRRRAGELDETAVVSISARREHSPRIRGRRSVGNVRTLPAMDEVGCPRK